MNATALNCKATYGFDTSLRKPASASPTRCTASCWWTKTARCCARPSFGATAAPWTSAIRLLAELGEEYCLENFLNSPGNFTASKLKWVRENEPEIYAQIHKIQLPGDYIAFKLTRRTADYGFRPLGRRVLEFQNSRPSPRSCWITTSIERRLAARRWWIPSAVQGQPHAPRLRRNWASRPARPSATAPATSPTTPFLSTC